MPGFWSWLFGTKETLQEKPPETPPALPPTSVPLSCSSTPPAPAVNGPAVLLSRDSRQQMEENLRRWRQSHFPRSWVKQHPAGWNHQDWVDLLARLEKSEYWPMDPAAIGAVLEEIKSSCCT